MTSSEEIVTIFTDGSDRTAIGILNGGGAVHYYWLKRMNREDIAAVVHGIKPVEQVPVKVPVKTTRS